MIKIIKKGTRDTRECDKCGCLFSFDEKDISVDLGIKKYIKCPQCEKEIILEQIKTIQFIREIPMEKLDKDFSLGKVLLERGLIEEDDLVPWVTFEPYKEKNND